MSTPYTIWVRERQTNTNASMDFRYRLIVSAPCEDCRATSYVIRGELRFWYKEGVEYLKKLIFPLIAFDLKIFKIVLMYKYLNICSFIYNKCISLQW